jgi:hypothetical protein
VAVVSAFFERPAPERLCAGSVSTDDEEQARCDAALDEMQQDEQDDGDNFREFV